ncbi:hypothetical protein [Chachezhania antarctica]|uniref:hypothetical protein n=1 Tax=Chachezhania antarctica TaxID=2340860 RepID=UPI000EAD8E93|nr:hypothetical protein [Chachezhania antarctica]|tara:strand:+ start:3334 stop:3663 length:330 start_codon:yes stop_codon:yes gene_type:complete
MKKTTIGMIAPAIALTAFTGMAFADDGEVRSDAALNNSPAHSDAVDIDQGRVDEADDSIRSDAAANNSPANTDPADTADRGEEPETEVPVRSDAAQNNAPANTDKELDG